MVLLILVLVGGWKFGFQKYFSYAGQPCTDSAQCKYGCFVVELPTSTLHRCSGAEEDVVFGDFYKTNTVYKCSSDIEIKGRCAPTDSITGSCSHIPFFDDVRYQIFEENKLARIADGVSYGCPLGRSL